MKQNIKLFLSSLVSNNTTIDGARKKPWYAAVIIFFVALVLSVIPTSVLQLQKHADKEFETTSYGFIEATHEFSKHLNDNDVTFYIQKEGKTSYLVADESANYEVTINKIKYVFAYIPSSEEAVNKINDEYTPANVSYMVFTPDELYVCALDPNSPNGKNPKVRFPCANAYKKIERDEIKNAYVEGTTTENLNNSWNNWKSLIRKFHNQTRLKTAAGQLGMSSIINATITLIMGFLVWVLTRGKNNPYHLFTVWDGFAIAFWAAFAPALLTTGLGFLFKNFASMMFPLLLGIRVMWLTMKSLRPDGSGYAAN